MGVALVARHASRYRDTTSCRNAVWTSGRSRKPSLRARTYVAASSTSSESTALGGTLVGWVFARRSHATSSWDLVMATSPTSATMSGGWDAVLSGRLHPAPANQASTTPRRGRTFSRDAGRDFKGEAGKVFGVARTSNTLPLKACRRIFLHRIEHDLHLRTALIADECIYSQRLQKEELLPLSMRRSSPARGPCLGDIPVSATDSSQKSGALGVGAPMPSAAHHHMAQAVGWVHSRRGTNAGPPRPWAVWLRHPCLFKLHPQGDVSDSSQRTCSPSWDGRFLAMEPSSTAAGRIHGMQRPP